MAAHSFATFNIGDPDSNSSRTADRLRTQKSLVAQPSRRMFFGDTSDQRYWGMHPPYDGLEWLLDQERYADALVFWCQENGSLDFYGNDGEWDLTHFKRRLASPRLVALKVAENAYIAKGMSERLAQLLLDLQREGRITIGRVREENLEVLMEPDPNGESIRSFPLVYSRPPVPI